MNEISASSIAGWRKQIRSLIALFFLVLATENCVHAKIPCTSPEFCEATLRPGSQCVDGFCDNPYQYGCLRTQIAGYEKQRVCNSDDPRNAAALGLCRDATKLDYSEIRIMSQNWESPFFEVSAVLCHSRTIPTDIVRSGCLPYILSAPSLDEAQLLTNYHITSRLGYFRFS